MLQGGYVMFRSGGGGGVPKMGTCFERSPKSRASQLLLLLTCMYTWFRFQGVGTLKSGFVGAVLNTA